MSQKFVVLKLVLKKREEKKGKEISSTDNMLKKWLSERPGKIY